MRINVTNTTINQTVKDVATIFKDIPEVHEIPKLVYHYKPKGRTDQKILLTI